VGLRLCFVIRQLNEGGAQRQLVELVRGLDKDQFDITIVTFYEGGQFEYEAKAIPRVKLMCLHKRGRWDVVPFLWRFRTTLRSVRPQVIHGYLGTANLLAILGKIFVPRVRVVWGVRSSNVDVSQYDWLSQLHYCLERVSARFADLIILNSAAAKVRHVNRGFPENKCVVIPNGIDLESFRRDETARMRIRDEWDVAESAKVIGLVGRFDPMKDHKTFLRAAALLRRERADVRFACVGGGFDEYGAKLKEFARELGLGQIIIWTGTRTDMVGVYSALDCLTSSSSYGEGFPNVVAEAMACSVPVVVTDVGDSAHIVGDLGEIVPAGDPQALAATWKRVLSQSTDEMEKLRRRLRERIERNFNNRLLVERTATAIEGLL